jgi:hypothetical protein
MLESIWRVASVKSWHSSKLIKFHVVCYSTTEQARRKIELHRSKPTVSFVLICPTLKNSFNQQSAVVVTKLCATYGAFSSKPLGYEETGSLIAFEHGCPNNAPAIFIEASLSQRNYWSPLFSKRTTFDITAAHSREKTSLDTAPFETLGFQALPLSKKFQQASFARQTSILLLCALSKRHQHLKELTSIVRLPLWTLDEAFKYAARYQWIDEKHRLTAAGHRLLNRYINVATIKSYANNPKPYYYPKALRVPHK